HRRRRASAAGQGPRRQPRDDLAQPWAARGRKKRSAGVQQPVQSAVRVRDAGAGDGGNAALSLPAAAVSEHTAGLAVAPDAPFGTEWPGLLRKLDRIDPSYRT